jgi:hypothetical protein
MEAAVTRAQLEVQRALPAFKGYEDFSMQIRNHQGTRFGIWNQRHAWFWFIGDARCKSAAIGVAANEQEAICEACSSIREIATRMAGAAESQDQRKSTGDSSCPEAGLSRLRPIERDCCQQRNDHGSW